MRLLKGDFKASKTLKECIEDMVNDTSIETLNAKCSGVILMGIGDNRVHYAYTHDVTLREAIYAVEQMKYTILSDVDEDL